VSVCPCTLTVPCRDSCSCAREFLSGGCDRCATYGSKEQQLAAAVRIAENAARLQRSYDLLARVAGIINSVRDWLRAARVSAEDLDRLADEVADVRTT
jgi:hypothetical protein